MWGGCGKSKNKNRAGNRKIRALRKFGKEIHAETFKWGKL
jgi:hypothetical protein